MTYEDALLTCHLRQRNEMAPLVHHIKIVLIPLAYYPSDALHNQLQSIYSGWL